MRKETPQEASFHDLLPDALGNMTSVSFGCQKFIQTAFNNLRTIYGSRAVADKSIEQYRSGSEYRNSCRIVSKCDNIPILSVDEIRSMIQADEDYIRRIRAFQELVAQQEGKSSKNSPSYRKDILDLADMLGILPDCGQTPIYRWMIDRRELSPDEKQSLYQKINTNLNVLHSAISVLSKTFTQGLLQTFPVVGTVFTQQKGKYFYRGENAFYGTSKPNIFRGLNPVNPDQAEELIRHLKMDEACGFLDRFEAVNQWNYSAVNYVALAQHYGIQTYMMDLTSDLKTALFFACCKYQDGAWRPLHKEEFAHSDSRRDVAKLGGDSRYGLIYRSPAELMDYKWLLPKGEDLMNNIVPVGYQPFMRCSSQYGYMLVNMDIRYDMLKDSWFQKIRFRLTEEICQWIFSEMDQGNKIYPNNDVPELERYMNNIRYSKTISLDSFDYKMLCNSQSEQNINFIKNEIIRRGYTFVQGDSSHITGNKLGKINRKYGIQDAYSRINELPVMSPILEIMPPKNSV